MVLFKILAFELFCLASFLLYKIVEHGRALKAARLAGTPYDAATLKRHRALAYIDLGIIFIIVLMLEFAIRILGAKPVYSTFFFFHLACAVTFLLSCLTALYATGIRHTAHHRPIVYVVVMSYILMATTGAYLLYQL